MRLGIAIGETWSFFHEIHGHLSARHETRLFSSRKLRLPLLSGQVNRRLFERDLKRFMRTSDVVFFEWASDLLCAASHLPKSCGIVTRLHRYELYRWAPQINWHAVDRVIVVSRAKLQEFATEFPEHAHKALVIPEAVSVERFQMQEKAYTGDIGILCHMKPRKRVYELVLAFHELVRIRPRFHLHVGGGRAEGFGEYYEAVQQLVERLGLRDNVTFYGRVTKPEDWYRHVDVYVSNGYSEGLQVSPMEAMASGCYCVSHHWDGADELLPEAQLYYTNTQLIERLLAYDDLAGPDRAEARSRMRASVIDRFNVDKTKLQIAQTVEEVNREWRDRSRAPAPVTSRVDVNV